VRFLNSLGLGSVAGLNEFIRTATVLKPFGLVIGDMFGEFF
jgi:hypothetical protein